MTARIRPRRALWLAVGLLAVTGWAGGATSAPRTSGTEGSVGTLSDVSVDDVDGATIVSLYGVADAEWTVEPSADGAGLSVSLPGVQPDFMPGRLVLENERVGSVEFETASAADGTPTTRIRIDGHGPLGHDVIRLEDRLEIRLVSRDLPEPSGSAEAPADDAGPAAAEAGMAEAEAEEADAPRARNLLGVEVEGDSSHTVVRIRTDGAVADAKTFTLSDPNRLVVDLPGVVNQVPDARRSLDVPQAARLRIGQHADKVRLVLDGTPGSPFEDHQLETAPDGVVLTLGEGSPMGVASVGDTPPPAEPAAAPAPAPAEALGTAAEAPVTVGGVTLDSLEDRDRVSVDLDRATEWRVYEPDAETVVLRVLGAHIDDEAAVRLIPPSGGPVSLVTSFQQPEVETPEVRVVMTRTAGVAPEVRREGDGLVVEFVKTAEQMASVAEPMAAGDQGAGAIPAPKIASVPADLDDPVPAAPAPVVPGIAGDEGATEAAHSRIGERTLGAVPANLDDGSSVGILEEGGFTEGKQYVGRRISLDFKDAEIDDVLRLVAEVSDLNVIAGDEVNGQVTIRLVDVPWDQALDVILMTQGLGFERVGNVLRIAPQDLIQAEREARLQERRALEKLEDLVVKLQPVNYADVTEVQKLVQRLLSGRGSVNVDERTSTLIMKDIPSVIDEATALVKAIDTQTPQVMIEAKIVEAQLDFSRELGSAWGAGSQPDEDFEDFGTGGVQPITAFGRGWPDSDANNVVVRNPISNAATGIMNLGSFLLNNRINVRLRLAAAEARGEGKVISSPRVVTLDNREATIEQGVSIPFQTFENGDAALEFIDAVLQLKVRPHITADRSIIMKLEVSRNAPDDSVPTPTGSPAISKNEAVTETLVKDGQTLVIGGIYVVDKGNSESRVPYLHKIPLLGAAFKNKAVRDIRKELLIFVTPRVVQPQEIGT